MKLKRKELGEVLTPDWLVEKMIRQAGDLKGVKVADLGANKGQFLRKAIEIWDVNPEDWTLIEIQKRYHRFHRRYTGWKVVNELTEKVDLLIGNPPYNGNIDLKLIQKFKHLTEKILVVHPSTWLIDLKGKSKLYNDFKKDLNLKSVEMFNGNPVFGIGLFVPCVITHIDNSHKGNINVKFFNDEYKVTDISDITKFGKDWQYIVKHFVKTIESHIEEHGNFTNHTVNVVDDSKFYAQFAAIIGNWDKSYQRMHRDNFYTLLIKNTELNKGIRGDFSRKNNPMPTFEFQLETEVNNFINFCKSDFARFCLSIYKDGQNLSGGGALDMIPWMDFTEEWNDEKLFAHFEIDQETQDYIRSFLPDYHGIRGNK